ncbi:MAG: sel1 repeat family protein [Myxococcales bacterium]|nr:sel1 repeat family protein [Myxococcales bacterium]
MKAVHLLLGLTLAATIGCGSVKPRPQSLNARCQAGEGKACLRLGLGLEDGRDDLPDLKRAAAAYGLACEYGELDGCWRRGELLRTGAGGVKRNLKRARALFVQACNPKRTMACLHLAEMERLGEGGPTDAARALARYQSLCKAGMAQACNDLGLAQQGQSADAAKVTLQKSCAAKNLLACANLGVLLVKAGDVAGALPLLVRACRGNEATACVQLAVLHEGGRVPGKAADPGRAAMLYQRACKTGHEDGCSGMALLLFLGKGVPAHPHKAARVWKTVCQAGHAVSCFNLAMAYRAGRGKAFPADAEAAKAWRLEACKLGLAAACDSK